MNRKLAESSKMAGALAAVLLLLNPVLPEVMASESEELDARIDRIGQRLGIDGHLAVRIIAMGLENDRSDRPEDADEVVCFYDRPTGSHISHVLCATNQALGSGPGGQPFSMFGGPEGNSGQTIGTLSAGGYLIAMPANPARMQGLIDSLGGLPGMNRRLVAMGLNGEPIPDDLPDRAELDRYADALSDVEAIGERYDPRIEAAAADEAAALRRESEQRMEMAIREQGLRRERYNRITELVARFPTLFEYVRGRVGG